MRQERQGGQSNRRESRQYFAVSSHRSERKGGPGDRIRGSAQVKLLLHTVHLVASLLGSLRI